MNERPVLLATNTFGLLDGDVNGVAYTCRNLVRQFRQAGIAVDVLTYGTRETIYAPEDHTRILVHAPVNGVNIDPTLRVDPFIGMGRIAREVKATRYSLVHSTTPDPLGWLAADVAKKQGIPLVAGYHTMVDVYARVRIGVLAERAARMLLDWYYSKAELILAPSGSVRTLLAQRYSSPVSVLGRGVDHDIFSPLHRTRGFDGEVRALYVGRVAAEKGLDALAGVFDPRSGCSLTIAGDGPGRSALERLLPHARFTGMITGERLSREFASGDFFVFPSETDSFGNVVLQAMSSGLPVVVMDKLGARESVIDGVTGIVARSRAEFADACRTLARDTALRERMRHAARTHAMHFRWDAILDRLLELYASAGWSARCAAVPLAA